MGFKAVAGAIGVEFSPLPKWSALPSLTLTANRTTFSVHFPVIPRPDFRAQMLQIKGRRTKAIMATATARRPAKAAAKTNSRPATSVKGGKIIYFFGKSRCDGKGDMKALLGGKGANLAAMTRIGLPVPPGFTITTEVCTYYYQNGKRFPPNQAGELAKAVAWLEKETGK